MIVPSYNRVELVDLIGSTPDQMRGLPVEPSEEWYNNLGIWQIIFDLLDGTQAMRAAQTTYAPKYESERAEGGAIEYIARISDTTLHPGFERCIQQNVGRVLSKPISVGDDVEARIKKQLDEDVDGAGSNMHQFLTGVVFAGQAYGASYVFVDSARTSETAPSREAAAKTGANRFVWSNYPAWAVTRRIRERVDGGARRITYIKTIEPMATTIAPNGAAQQVPVCRIWLDPKYTGTAFAGFWEYRLVDDKWIATDHDGNETGQINLTEWDRIPVARFQYEREVGNVDRDQAFFENVAHENVFHWNRVSQYRNSLRKASQVVPVITGANSGEVSWGGGTLFLPADARLEIPEHSGATLTMVKTALDDSEAKMRWLAFEPVMRQTGDATATEEALRASEAGCVMDVWLRSTKDAVEQLLQFSAEALGLDKARGGTVTMQQKYVPTPDDSAAMQELQWAVDERIISRRRMFSELKRRARLADDADFEAEKKIIAEENADETYRDPEVKAEMGKRFAEGADEE